MTTRLWSVGQLARAGGVTVRTLHYYEEIGLVPASERTASGHRRYTDADVRRLYQVRALHPDFRGLAALGDDQFICTAPGSATDVVSRVFVPGAGIDEDSVTGSAHAVLAPFWAARLGRSAYTAHQATTRGGDLTCRLDGAQAWLGGHCTTVVEGTFYVSG